MQEVSKVCVKWHQYLRNGLNIWEMAKIFEKWLRDIDHGLSI